MADKHIDLDMPVFEAVSAFPEVKEIMAELGFGEIAKSGMLQTMGRVMTLRKGSHARGVALGTVVAALQERGFAVAGYETSEPEVLEEQPVPAADLSTAEGRQQRLEQLVRRLSGGEDLEAIRAEFVRDFSSVSAQEIASAEQNLILGGMPISEVQQLCDVHSALFHGRIEDEVCRVAGSDGLPAGHPVNVLKRENEVLLAKLGALESMIAGTGDVGDIRAGLEELKALKNHYGKKEELLMPLLYEHGLTGPSDVMWGVDDEILHELSAICRGLSPESHAEMLPRIQALMVRIREMAYKEEQIFLPLCLEHLTEEEWFSCYRDLGEFGWAFEVRPPRWLEGDVWVATRPAPENPLMDGKIRLPTGELGVRELEAVLKLLPVDLTFIDADDTTRFFTNEGKVFARPLSCLGREVWSCHPPRVVPLVKAMIEDFKSKKRDRMEVWTPDPADPIRVLYLAVYDDAGEYLGTLEVVQRFAGMLPKLGEILADGRR